MTFEAPQTAKLQMAHSLGLALMFGLALVFLYVAALGPLISLAARGHIPGQVINTVYAPLPRSVGIRSIRVWSHLDEKTFRDADWGKP